ncbi:GATS protein-like 3 [Blyttiomyces sp. JEL0837]|nr:GATS protein-like 3 [Blyttiomyces sp. JEL0837]
MAEDPFRALQIDSNQGLETSGKRINDLSGPLAKAGISIFYLSTYHTDFIFVKEKRVPLVIQTLRQHHFSFYDAGNLSIELLANNIDAASGTSSHPPPTPLHRNIHANDSEGGGWLSFRSDEVSGSDSMSVAAMLGNRAASSVTSPTNGGRRLDKKVLESENLRLVGLNRDYIGGWAMELLRILFYMNQPSETETQTGRFLSFTMTEEGTSLVADAKVLENITDHYLLTSTEPTSLRCIQVDLTQFGLDRYGIVWSMAQPLVAREINLLYISTATAANILVDEVDLEQTLLIMDQINSAASTGNETNEPHSSIESSDAELEEGDEAGIRSKLNSDESTGLVGNVIEDWNPRSQTDTTELDSLSSMRGFRNDEEPVWEAEGDLDADEFMNRGNGGSSSWIKSVVKLTLFRQRTEKNFFDGILCWQPKMSKPQQAAGPNLNVMIPAFGLAATIGIAMGPVGKTIAGIWFNKRDTRIITDEQLAMIVNLLGATMFILIILHHYMENNKK